MQEITAPSAKDISYASSARTAGGRVVIRLMENATGRQALLKRARGYGSDISEDKTFFDVMATRYGLSLDIVEGQLESVPWEGPLILIANHPYGILDGLMMGCMLSRLRGSKFWIMANSVFSQAPDLTRHLVPIRFDETKEAVALNIQSRKFALDFLREGGAIGIFPGGTVSTSATPFSHPLDPAWRNFTARMIIKSKATILPVFFHGQTSRTFQIASHLHYTLRMGLLIKEFRKRVDTPVRVSIGRPLSHEMLAPVAADPNQLMRHLWAATYALSPDPISPHTWGYEFEDRYREGQNGANRGRNANSPKV